MTAPLTVPDCDLRGLPFMPLHGDKLVDSDLFLISTGDEFKAAVALWWASWKQIPAASLPSDERLLAGLARLDPKRWAKVRAVAMRGWLVCSDGRYYHPTVADLANEAWSARLSQRSRTEAARAAKAAKTEQQQGSDSACDKLCDRGSNSVQGTGTGTGTEERANALSPAGAGERDLLGDADGPAKPKPRRKPEVAIPDDFPDAAAISGAQDRMRAEGANLDAARQAERFRNHALQIDRRCRDWMAAWRNWVDKAAETAPRLPGASRPKTPARPPSVFAGPPEVREDLRTCTGASDELVKHFLDRCTWRDLPKRTIVAPNVVVADKLNHGLGWRLFELGIEVVVERAV